jgi:glycosyltransferase involved in cell wall biosynthesis
MASGIPDLSVIMGVRNALPFLDNAVESVLDQTFSDFEFIILDDASDDGTSMRLEEWQARDSRIRLIRLKQRRGLGFALNRGVIEARAETVVRMDADDVSLPHRFEVQYEQFRDTGADIMGTWALDINVAGDVVGERRVPIEHDDIARLIWTCPLIHPTVMFRRSGVLSAGSYSADLQRRQDFELWFRCLRSGLRFANIPEYLLHYRHTGDYYAKNDVRVAWEQAVIGLRGCRMVRSSPAGYVGVMTPLIRSILPAPVRPLFHRIMAAVDPRMRSASQR